MLDSPSTTPKVAGRWDTALVGMKYRIMKRKLNFINSPKNADDDFLAKQIYLEQVRNHWPGLATESSKLCEELNLPDITTDVVSRYDINRRIEEGNKKEIMEEMKKSSKMKGLADEDFERKPYLEHKNVTEARVKFAQRSAMFPCKTNYMSDPSFREDLFVCDSCESAIDTMSHVMICPAYQQLREGKDVNSDKDVLEYLVAVSRIRSNLGLRR